MSSLEEDYLRSDGFVLHLPPSPGDSAMNPHSQAREVLAKAYAVSPSAATMKEAIEWAAELMPDFR